MGRTRPIAWPARLVLGIVRYEADDLVEARRELEGGFEEARQMGIGRPVLGWAIPYLALVRLACGDPDLALDALHTSQHDRRTTGMALPGYAGEIEARILLRQGDVAGAGRWADRARPEGPSGSPLLELLRRSMDTTIARVRLAQGRPDEARELLVRTRADQEASGAVADLISSGVLEARVADATGRRAEALRALERSVGLAAPGGCMMWCAALLPDGAVLVTGGEYETTPTCSSAELYDPGSGTWTAASNMLAVRSHDTATLLADGTVLVAGGDDYGTDTLASAEVYDPGSGQ